MKVNIKKLNDNAIIPYQAHEGDAGFDLHACIDKSITIQAYCTKMIPTGLTVAIPNGCFGAVYARSGLATKEGLRPANCVGVIDSNYRGEIMVALHNDSKAPKTVNSMDRIAQLVIQPYITVDFNETDELDDTDRGVGGFGSSGK